MRYHSAGLLLASVSLSACTVGPDYVRPGTPSNAAAPFISTAASTDPSAEPDARWWQLYRDPLLDRLVQEALSANTDIRVALARLDKVRAGLRGAQSLELPQTQLAGSATRQRYPGFEVLPQAPQVFDSADLGFSAAYELDLFGRVRRSVEAARGQVQAADADLDEVGVTVAAETTRAYLDALTSREQIRVARKTLALLDKSVSVTKARVEAGQNERLDLLREQALRDQRASAIAPLVAAHEGALFRLAALLGQTPHDLPAAVVDGQPLPTLSTPIPVGDGAGLLARRPDVRAAERRLAAATATIGIATADFFPRITLGGSVGSTSDSFSSAFTGGTFRYGVGPQISWAFPNFAAVRARVNASKADTRAALATFDGTVLTALKEAETALSAYGRALEEQAALTRARDEAERAANVAITREKDGAIDFLSVLDAERTLADAEAELAVADARVASRQVDLFKALGGGWQHPPAPPGKS